MLCKSLYIPNNKESVWGGTTMALQKHKTLLVSGLVMFSSKCKIANLQRKCKNKRQNKVEAEIQEQLASTKLKYEA